MEKTENSINEIIIDSEFDHLHFPFFDFIPSEQENKLELFNKNFGLEDLPKKSLLNSLPHKKVKFITHSKANKPSFIVSKKTKREETISKDSNGRWTKKERIKFAHALYTYGTDWKKIKEYIGTRDNIQIRSHGQKFLIKLKESKMITEKGLDISKLNWENSFKVLKNNIDDKELFSLLISIECELEDNKRMTLRYKERKESMLKKKEAQIEQNNTFLTTSDENTEKFNINENYLENDMYYDKGGFLDENDKYLIKYQSSIDKDMELFE